ncbi:MAG: ribosome biogenesis GTPase Der [Lentisphaeria bacterium]
MAVDYRAGVGGAQRSDFRNCAASTIISEISYFMQNINLPKVVIVGRPNVGKSSLYNRILGRQEAIVLREAGITRDAVANPAQWADKLFLLCDTGGLNLLMKQVKDNSDHQFDTKIRERLLQAAEMADLIIFVVDAHDGITDMDREIARYLHTTGHKVLLVLNKCDNPQFAEAAYDMAPLGFGQPVEISLTHNFNISSMMDEVVKLLPESSEYELPKEPDMKIAFVGRPNVGKSSTVNRLLGHDRVIVSEVAGTTRDAIDIPMTIKSYDSGEMDVTLIDTAGLRGLRKVDTVVERFSMMRTENAIKRADLVIFVIDANEPATAQDKRIARTIQDAGAACMILVNKWDLVQGKTTYDKFQEWVRYELPGVSYAPLLFASAKTGFNYNNIINNVFRVKEAMNQELTTSIVNRFFEDLVLRHSPPIVKGKALKIYYAILEGTTPPSFKLYVNDKECCTRNYLSFMRNKIEDTFNFVGFPIRIYVENRPRKDYHKF